MSRQPLPPPRSYPPFLQTAYGRISFPREAPPVHLCVQLLLAFDREAPRPGPEVHNTHAYSSSYRQLQDILEQLPTGQDRARMQCWIEALHERNRERYCPAEAINDKRACYFRLFVKRCLWTVVQAQLETP